MTDKICLHGIDVYGYHGVLPAERELGQRFVIDVDLWADCSEAALTDDLSHALDYSKVHGVVIQAVQAQTYHLIEALAGELCRALLQGTSAGSVSVRVEKVQPPIAQFTGTAAVVMKRDRQWLETTYGGERE